MGAVGGEVTPLDVARKRLFEAARAFAESFSGVYQCDELEAAAASFAAARARAGRGTKPKTVTAALARWRSAYDVANRVKIDGKPPTLAEIAAAAGKSKTAAAAAMKRLAELGAIAQPDLTDSGEWD